MENLQKQVDDWVTQYKIGYFKPLEILARMTEEVGEVARELNHRFGPKKKKPSEDTQELGVELADILFTICCLANSLGIRLDDAFKQVMDKCYGRDKNRFEKKL
ncbi:nucleotide pyrophosphohydrolase [Candidatus Parcubacteria bacterium]|nr:nucleotide pyrophosphohydrolase [Candidatus Parcubacteria bacterium]